MIVHPLLAKARFTRAVRPLIDNRPTFARVGIGLVEYQFPYLYLDLEITRFARRVRLRVDGRDYDYRPVDGRWVDGDHRILRLGQGLVPCGNGFHAEPMDGCDGPWFCFPGWRTWHDHSSHQDTPWPALRKLAEYAPVTLIRQLHTELNRDGVSFQ